MTDTSPSPLALAPDQTAAMRETWVANGLDPAVFDAAASGPTDTPEAAPADVEVEGLTNLKQPTLTPAQAEELAAEMIRAGMPEDQVRAALEADGYAPAAADERTDEEKEFDRAFGAASPEAYKIDFRNRTPAGMDMPQVVGANTEMTTWLSQAGFPPEIGPAVLERAMDAGQRYARMSESERELWTREQHAEFARMAGSPERAAELTHLASAVLVRGGEAFSAALAKSGALDDAGVLMHLAHQGARLAARASGAV